MIWMVELTILCIYIKPISKILIFLHIFNYIDISHKSNLSYQELTK